MSLKLKKSESVSSGLRRLIGQRLHIAMGELERVGPQADEAVHNARKRLKESRAILRLLRPAIPDAVYQSEKSAYRDAARPLSHVRDARVLLDALNQTASPAEGETIEVPTIRKELEARRNFLHHELASNGHMPGLRDSLSQALSRIDDWPVESGEWRTLRRGIRPIYRRGRRLMRKIDKLADDDRSRNERLHEWRKQTKALWYQVQVLEHIWPATMESLAEQIHQLTDLLGEDHDLAVLRELIAGNEMSDLPPLVRDKLLERIDARRCDLQSQSLEAGRRVYAERPKAFVQRLGSYWRTWKAKPAKTDSPPPEAKPAISHDH